MIQAVIDIGSNSIRFLVTEGQGGKVVPLKRELKTTRLGNREGNGNLKIEAMHKTITVIQEYLELAAELKVEQVYGLATSAVREALNGKLFLQRIKDETNLDVKLLSGKEEGYLSWLGAVKSLELKEDSALVFDLGGGSTEFAWGKEIISLPLGAVVLTQRFFKEDPPSKTEIKNIEDFLREQLAKVHQLKPSTAGFSLIGVGGTATTLAAVKQKLEIYDSSKVHGYSVSLQDIEEILYNFLDNEKDERRNIPGLMIGREDIIIAGTLVVKNIMEFFNCANITVSEGDLMEGYLLNIIESEV